jgi:RHH-type proline utilization regulon transcriptional repressor/proline dehydrogenase/delta 1-pyrroline-5-carboxylate dehydrogenase
MEEYRDLALTVAAFEKTLESPDLSGARAGIALQAYLPDSWEAQKQLTLWAQRRVAAGGAPIRIRLVKGANLAMETVEAELHGWNPAPYPSKSDTDANFHRMLEFGCQPANARVVRLGVASHNLFDIALALGLRERNGVAEHVELEMLEGMANHQARVVQKAAGNLLVYAPVVHREDFNSAMAYLVRRLDENTAPENFLRDLFALSPGSARWKIHADRFAASWRARTAVSSAPRRGELPVRTGALFENEPDTDWTQPLAREALRTAIGRQSQEPWPAPTPLEALLGVAINAQPAWNALGFEARAAWTNAYPGSSWNTFEELLPAIASTLSATNDPQQVEDLLRGVADQTTFRQNLYVIIVAAQRLSPPIGTAAQRVLADQRAAITVIRDAYTGRWGIHDWCPLPE